MGTRFWMRCRSVRWRLCRSARGARGFQFQVFSFKFRFRGGQISGFVLTLRETTMNERKNDQGARFVPTNRRDFIKTTAAAAAGLAAAPLLSSNARAAG